LLKNCLDHTTITKQVNTASTTYSHWPSM